MTDKNNSELMEYLKAEFAKMATKDDLAGQKEEIMRHTGILVEDIHHKLDLVIEGFVGANQNFEKHKEDNGREHSRLDKMDLINSVDISKLDQRVTRLEG